MRRGLVAAWVVLSFTSCKQAAPVQRGYFVPDGGHGAVWGPQQGNEWMRICQTGSSRPYPPTYLPFNLSVCLEVTFRGELTRGTYHLEAKNEATASPLDLSTVRHLPETSESPGVLSAWATSTIIQGWTPAHQTLSGDLVITSLMPLIGELHAEVSGTLFFDYPGPVRFDFAFRHNYQQPEVWPLPPRVSKPQPEPQEERPTVDDMRVY